MSSYDPNPSFFVFLQSQLTILKQLCARSVHFSIGFGENRFVKKTNAISDGVQNPRIFYLKRMISKTLSRHQLLNLCTILNFILPISSHIARSYAQWFLSLEITQLNFHYGKSLIHLKAFSFAPKIILIQLKNMLCWHQLSNNNTLMLNWNTFQYNRWILSAHIWYFHSYFASFLGLSCERSLYFIKSTLKKICAELGCLATG